jgi:hypothetical protein
MAQDNQSGFPPLFDFDTAASKQQALCDLMRNAIVDAVQTDKEACMEDTFEDYHPPMVCRALAVKLACLEQTEGRRP